MKLVIFGAANLLPEAAETMFTSITDATECCFGRGVPFTNTEEHSNGHTIAEFKHLTLLHMLIPSINVPKFAVVHTEDYAIYLMMVPKEAICSGMKAIVHSNNDTHEINLN